MRQPNQRKGKPAMKILRISLGVSGGFTALVAAATVVVALGACGKNNESWDDGGPGGYTTLADGNRVPNSSLGNQNPDGNANNLFNLPGMMMPDAGSDATMMGMGPPMAVGTVNAQDCNGCRFPNTGAAACNNAPPIQIVYPADTVILPPNLNVISIHWTPYGGGYQLFSVDFSAPPLTDWHILTSCANQTADQQAGGNPSGGCELQIDPVSWSKLVQVNRDASPVTVTVRGTTDGRCISASNSIHINFAKEDLLGTYYYWKSFVTQGQGVGGQIWMKVFGDLNMQEQDVTSNVSAGGSQLQATCNGCHALSRDGTRMVVYSDDNDSDDEYTDVSGSLLDMAPLAMGQPAVQLGTGANPNRMQQGGQPPGFSAINPPASFYVSSNGMPILEAGTPPQGIAGGTSTSNGYPNVVQGTQFSVWDGMGNFSGQTDTGCSAGRPTMPDWSVDGKTVIFVNPQAVASWSLTLTGTATDDDHVFGGSFCTMPYSGMGKFGAASMFLQSQGENNYYPSFSPDSVVTEAGSQPPAFVLFNRVPNKSGQGTNCTGGNSSGFCPNDSFSNPDARLWLMPNMPSATPIDLEKANGSPASSPVSFSNSYPRWAPFVQVYHGNKILWFTFSSTRDYGLDVLNHKNGMYQCYPPDTPEWTGAMHGQTFDPACQQPQIWMAPILFHEGMAANVDPSGVAFWIPYQDATQHNHTAQWTWKPNPPPPIPPDGAPPPCKCSHIYGPCGAANGGCGCCMNEQLQCSGSQSCISVAN